MSQRGHFPVMADPERVAQLIAHRACIGMEHDPANGKLHGYCVVCGVPWPCDYAGKSPTPSPNQAVAENVVRAEVVEKETVAALGSGQELLSALAADWRDKSNNAENMDAAHIYGICARALDAALALPLAPKVPHIDPQGGQHEN